MELPKKILLISGSLFFIIVVFGFLGFSTILQTIVRYETALRRGGLVRNYYLKLPISLDFKVYFFNVTNPVEVGEGELPKLKEIGPYWYDSYKEKIDIIDNDAEDSLTYTPYETYHFNQEKSGSLKQEDYVTILNPFVVGMINYVLQTDRAVLMPIVIKAMDLIFQNPQSIYFTVKVRDILFDGITINCTLKDYPVKAVCPQIRMLLHELVIEKKKNILMFSFLGMRNGTVPKRFKVLRGIKKSKDLGRLIEYNYQKRLTIWSRKDCNEFHGTDGWIFPPFLTPEEGIWTFSHDICRNMRADYIEDLVFRNIPTRKYYVLLGDQSSNLEDKCYCPSQDSCLPRGIMDLTKCMGVPIYATLPHLLDVPESIRKQVEGLQPDMEKHAIRIIFEYMTGTPVQAAKRLQFNLPIRRQNKVDFMKRIPEALHPIIWVEESVELRGKVFKQIYAVILLLKYYNIFRYCFLGCTIIGLLVGGYLFYKQKNQTTITPKVETPKSDKEQNKTASLYSRETTAEFRIFGPSVKDYDFDIKSSH